MACNHLKVTKTPNTNLGLSRPSLQFVQVIDIPNFRSSKTTGKMFSYIHETLAHTVFLISIFKGTHVFIYF